MFDDISNNFVFSHLKVAAPIVSTVSHSFHDKFSLWKNVSSL